MKRLLVAVALALVAVSSSAAIQYEFTQKNTTTANADPISDLSARAIIDGESSRIDFLGGSLYPPGTYVISTDGSRRLLFVDPAKEWFTEINTAGVATALGSSNIRISNFKSSLETKDDRPVIAGIPTEHTRLTLTYDITLTMKAMPLSQHVRTEIDTWATTRFAASSASSFLTSMRTGNPDIDRLLDVEAMKVKGFPMRQTVTTRTLADLPPTKSELNVPTAKTIIREMWVTSIREVAPDASVFLVPTSYRRADVPLNEKAATVLTPEQWTTPPSK